MRSTLKAEPDTFETEIRPIFDEHCIACHGLQCCIATTFDRLPSICCSKKWI